MFVAFMMEVAHHSLSWTTKILLEPQTIETGLKKWWTLGTPIMETAHIPPCNRMAV